MLLNFEGEAEGITTDAIVGDIAGRAAGAWRERGRARRRRHARRRAIAPSRFDERFLRKLDRWRSLTRRARISAASCAPSAAAAASAPGIEFADHRDYAPGDDLRYLDWNLYGRLERLLLRLFEEEEDLLDLLPRRRQRVDGRSATPPKLDLALQVGAALAYVGLANLDRVSLITRSASDAMPGLPPARGKARILPIAALPRRRRRRSGRDGARGGGARVSCAGGAAGGAAWWSLISDFYDPAGYRAGAGSAAPPPASRPSSSR